jgi:hypothetical protein
VHRMTRDAISGGMDASCSRAKCANQPLQLSWPSHWLRGVQTRGYEDACSRELAFVVQLPITANVVPSSRILSTLKMETFGHQAACARQSFESNLVVIGARGAAVEKMAIFLLETRRVLSGGI